MIGTQTTKGTDLKNPTTLGVKSCKLPTEVLSTTPMTASPVRSKSLNSFTEASSIQNLKLFAQGETLLTYRISKEGFDTPLFLCHNI